MAHTIKAFDESGKELFTLPASNASRMSTQASANEKIINQQRKTFPTMHRIELANHGHVYAHLLVGERYLEPAVMEDGKLRLMFP